MNDNSNVQYDKSHIHRLLRPSDNETLIYIDFNIIINKLQQITEAARKFLMRLIKIRETGKMVDMLLNDNKPTKLVNKKNIQINIKKQE